MKQINFKNIFKIYKGTLREYTEELWINKRGDGSVVNLGEMHPAVVSELAEKNIYLEDTRILVDQRSATKYFAHPKSKKGALLPIDKYDLLEKAVKQPLKIF